MKLFSKEQIYEGDKLTALKQNITSTELMERAGIQIFNWIHRRMQGAQVTIHIFCGIGNNGGDGLVVARHLIIHGYNVFTYVVNYSNKRSEDFLKNYDRYKQTNKEWPLLMSEETPLPKIGMDDIIIDAVFGIGLNRPAEQWVQSIFKHFKESRAYTLSIDIPSGLYTDKVPQDPNAVVWANITLSFQSPKIVFFLPQTAKFTQQWEILDIGIDEDFLSETPVNEELIGKYEVLPIYRPREKFAHKGQLGHSLVIGGSYGKIGSVVLATKAVLSSGAGLVTAYIPKCGYLILQTAFPEAMVITDEDSDRITAIKTDFEPTVIGIGVGLGTHSKTLAAFTSFLKNNNKPLVVDADAINLLAKEKSLLKQLPTQTVLTPHPKELERLIGEWKDDFDKLQKVSLFSTKYNVIVVIKGGHSIVVYKDKKYVNSSGNQGLATAGSGDVLTGVITGLISQGYSPLNAAIFGVYLHGKSADIALETKGYQSLIASYVIDYLGEAYISLFEPLELLEEEEGN